MIPVSQQQQIATTLADSAEVISNTQLAKQLTEEPEDVQAEILRINSESRDRSLQVALLIPVFASLIGFGNAFRMRRLPDIEPSANLEGMDLG